MPRKRFSQSYSRPLICLEVGPRRAFGRKRVEERGSDLRPPCARHKNPSLLGLGLPSRAAIFADGLSAIHESVPTAFHEAFYATGSFSVQSVVSTTRRSLATHARNRRSFFWTSSPAIVRAHTPILVLTSKSTPRPSAAPRISCVAPHPSSTPSTPTASERSRQHAPRLPAPLASREHDLQQDGNARDASHDLEAATCALQRVRRCTTFIRSTVTVLTRPQPLPAPPAARVAPDASVPRIAFPYTVTLQQCTVFTIRRLRLPYSSAPPSACAARDSRSHRRRRFIASSRAKCVSNKYHYPRPTRTPGASSPRHASAWACVAPPYRLRRIAGARSKCNERFVAHHDIASNRLPACRAHAALGAEPLPAAHREHDVRLSFHRRRVRFHPRHRITPLLDMTGSFLLTSIYLSAPA
ncbi:hypothetical protein C8R45DRAFT_1219833 [Mycena sanguinolenta]|nr:hypothetical protein C8R45DRAFT_1219833 [Mycena sanguinolenta]